MATNKRTLSRIGFYCGLALFLIITLFPFFVMLMTSFKSAKEAISLHPTLLPQQWTLEHYVDIFNPVIFPFVDYFRNSMVVSVVSSVVAVFLGILGAYALSRLRFKGRMTINASFTRCTCSPAFCWWCRCSKLSPRWAFTTPRWR
ncbi:Inner membrane ABC transporter permease protein YcjP [Shigella boydii ATCC 9905]|nr:Inner membrane ABC transporter permease protein YcjP [Shigella boydii ATCC 9905]